MLRSLNDALLRCIAPLVNPQQGSSEQASAREVYTQTKSVFRKIVNRVFLKCPDGTFVLHLLGTLIICEVHYHLYFWKQESLFQLRRLLGFYAA